MFSITKTPPSSPACCSVYYSKTLHKNITIMNKFIDHTHSPKGPKEVSRW